MITEILYVTRETAWLPWAVQYFFLIGLSAGCFLLSLPGMAYGRADWRKLSRLALLGALVCGTTAPVALLADLHQPGRFLNFYLHPQLDSWMAWGAFFIPLYLGGLFLYAWAALRPDFRAAADSGGLLAPVQGILGGAAVPGLVRAFALVALAGAFLVLLYTGVEVMVIEARPLWHTPVLPLQFAATALAGSLGLVLVFNRTMGDVDAQVEARLNRCLAATLVVVMALGGVWFALGLSGLSATHAAALAEVAPSPSWKLTALWGALATVVPLAVALRWPAGSGWITGLIALHSAWMFRWTVFIGGQDIPKTGAGFYEYTLPLGPEGLMGIVGTAGLWVFVLIVLVTLLPWSEARAQNASPTAAKGV